MSLSVLLVVVTNPPAGGSQDEKIANILTAAGHSVTYQVSTTALPDTGYDVAVITESGSASSAANNSIPTCLLPVVFLDTNWNTTGISSAAATAGSPDSLNVDILTTATSIDDGLSDPAAIRSSNASMYGTATANLASGVVALADHGGQAGHVVIAIADTGAALTSGNAPNRRVAYGPGVGSSGVSTWTATGDTLFRQAVEWAAPSAPAAITPLKLEDGLGFLLTESRVPLG
jgi:hypothetical protein